MEAKTVYYLNPVMVAKGVVGNLVLQDLGGGFQMIAGQEYDFDTMFGVQVANSKDLNLAANLGWVHKKVLDDKPTSKPKAESVPEAISKPTTKSKYKAKSGTTKAVETKPATKSKSDSESKPETKSVDVYVPTPGDMTKASQVFDIAKGMGTIHKKANNWIVPMPDGSTKNFGSPVEVIDVLASDPLVTTHIQKLNQGE